MGGEDRVPEVGELWFCETSFFFFFWSWCRVAGIQTVEGAAAHCKKVVGGDGLKWKGCGVGCGDHLFFFYLCFTFDYVHSCFAVTNHFDLGRR